MFRRTLLGFVAVMGMLAVGSGTAMADHRGGYQNHGHHHHHGHYSGYANRGYGGYGGYSGYRSPSYGMGYGYGYRPVVVAPRAVVVPGYGCQSAYAVPSYGYGGYGAYGYGSPYRTGLSYSSPGFGVFIGR